MQTFSFKWNQKAKNAGLLYTIDLQQAATHNLTCNQRGNFNAHQIICNSGTSAYSWQPVFCSFLSGQRQRPRREDSQSANLKNLLVHRTFHPAFDRVSAQADRPRIVISPYKKRRRIASPFYLISDYSQYTSTNNSNQTTSTKCQYHATPSKAKW